MQETHPEGMERDQAEKLGLLRREFFQGKSDKELMQKMDNRLKALNRGEVLSRRFKVDMDELPEMAKGLAILILAAAAPTTGAVENESKR